MVEPTLKIYRRLFASENEKSMLKTPILTFHFHFTILCSSAHAARKKLCNWLQIFANFKIQVRNTSKISKYYIQPKYQNTAHFGEFSKIFKILVQKFCAISEVLRRFLLFFLVELETCWKMTPWSSKSASIQPIFCYFEPKFYFDILTIFWYFGALPDWNQSPNILTWKSALRKCLGCINTDVYDKILIRISMRI